MIFLSLKNACTFLLAKEKTRKSIFNTNSELSQNCTEKQFMSFKTTVNWLFNDIWCYSVIGCFNWKIGVFQQSAASVYCILKRTNLLVLALLYENCPLDITIYFKNLDITTHKHLRKDFHTHYLLTLNFNWVVGIMILEYNGKIVNKFIMLFHSLVLSTTFFLLLL